MVLKLNTLSVSFLSLALFTTASLNAQTLVIKLTKLPFGEATWIVPISGGSQ